MPNCQHIHSYKVLSVDYMKIKIFKNSMASDQILGDYRPVWGPLEVCQSHWA